MQSLLHSSPLLPFKSTKTLASSNTFLPTKLVLIQTSTSRFSHPIKALTPDVDLSQQVDYSSMPSSVFPAEACETIGGDACDAEIYPEIKLQAEPKSNKASTDTETVDREYLDYNNPKTVFPDEACDDLGGEFCEPTYQSGVF